ncbi:acyl-CoA synthetase (AMP-forming)/AMP-acid ligase II [Nakamurella sp. UYEF19]|uniref:class I adenylate-forming enzyme family protein n=1 Tax=Nakamurella sp. UYEF19 TaxID=1756392 RepID=UPI003394089D
MDQQLETVGAVLARSLHRAGDRIAVRARGELRTHRELLAGAARFANTLAGNGLQPGDRVALMVSDRAESVEAYLGCLLGGYPAVHVNDRLAAPEVAGILADARARAIVYTGEVGPRLAELDVVADTDLVVAIGQPAAAVHARWADLLATASNRPPEIPREPDDLVIIGYTSGTTGTPKGVMHSQRTMLRTLRHMPVHFDMRPGSRCAFTGTLSFVSGIWGVVLPHLYLGGEISFLAGLTPDQWFDTMVAQGSQFTYVPTPLAGEFVAQVRRRPEVLDTLRVAMHSGSAMPAADVRRLVDIVDSRFAEAYGMTETGAPVTRTEAADWTLGCEAQDVHASVGRPVHIADVSIVDGAGNPLPVGQTGEITVSSETQFVGYFRRPDLTADAVRNGRLHTGDIGRLDEAGYLYVTDRAKDMIISGGMNVYPAEVERALAGLPGLAELAVFGVPDARWGETVVAFAVASDPSLDQAAVIEAARARLASYKKPTQVRFLDSLPRTASLKIDKPALRRLWSEHDGFSSA